MPVEIGKVVDGTVTGITNFGAFIQLPDGITGLCHISEIADEYVKDVKDYLKEQQRVKVKVIEVSGNGKVSLSIRKATEGSKQKNTVKKEAVKEFVSRPVRPKASFEDMLARFLKDSDEKLKDMKKNVNKRKGNGYNRK
ncbi:S1 RNA binding domain protein [Caminicella sporogenes DSM 14501]|uniref:S1 RNA binding domain protein n=1 Tax=Caminicella sporogenes DSM 14501 TaxID=1121266 RepID=A0A1M6QSN7_9FIRM|nr:S1 RNA-binding domain-containing protein [Caminicella sporogenes]RKD20926.1 RNA-binding protein S1 [Caminicella sporogenes]SHK23226.1 S1 RNA binding domain protein [Caminicella sporogenes DSM 14501]